VNRLIVTSLALLCWVESPALAVEPDGDLKEELREVREQLAKLQAAQDARDQQEAAQHETPTGAVVILSGETQEEALAVWNDLHVHGTVTGEALAVGGDVVVHEGGHVGGDVVSIGGSVTVEEGATVDGDRVALKMSEYAGVDASAQDHHASGSLYLASQSQETLQWLYHRMVWMLTVAGAGVITVGLFPDRVARVAANLEEGPVRAAVVGTTATSLLLLFAVLLVAVTVGIGSPISLAVVAALAGAWLLGFVGFCQAVGDRLPVDSKVHGRWLALLAGVMLLSFAGSLPWVGWFGLVGVSMVGIGASLSTRFGAA
jgi:cytoskeletal protein CcmA (bactofilin family)